MVNTNSTPRGIVLFLGAGFSKGMFRRAPLTKRLLPWIRAAKRNLLENDHHRNLESLIARNSQYLAGSDNEPDFEKVLQLVFDQRDTDEGRLYRALEHAIITLVEVRPRPADTDQNIRAMVNTLYEWVAKKGVLITIVTTNYDLAAERVAERVNFALDRGFLDINNPGLWQSTFWKKPWTLSRFQFGTEIRFVVEAKNNKTTVKSSDYGEEWRELTSAIRVLKLHGSMNWAYCRRCKKLDLSATKEEVFKNFTDEGMRCVNCTQIYECRIVPPLVNKQRVYNHITLKAAWQSARDAMRNAETVFFIGVSMADYDEEVNKLIVSSWKEAGWDYCVIDPSARVHDKFGKKLGNPRRPCSYAKNCKGFIPKKFNSVLL